MYGKIMVPVDLAHPERLDKALLTAADLAIRYDARICYVGVTAAAPSSAAATPQQFSARLAAFAADEATRHGIRPAPESLAKVSHDPAADLNKTLLQAVAETGADLVVMASHVPGLAEHLFAAHAGYLAQHAGVSVFVVR